MVNLKVEGFEDNTKIQEQLRRGIQIIRECKLYSRGMNISIVIRVVNINELTAYACFDGTVDGVDQFEICISSLMVDLHKDVVVGILLHEIGHIVHGDFDKMIYLDNKFCSSKTFIGRVFYGIRRAIHLVNDTDVLKEIVIKREEKIDKGLKVNSAYEKRYQYYLEREIDADNIVMEVLTRQGLEVDTYIELLKTNHCKYGIVGGKERIANLIQFKNNIKNSISNKRI